MMWLKHEEISFAHRACSTESRSASALHGLNRLHQQQATSAAAAHPDPSPSGFKAHYGYRVEMLSVRFALRQATRS